MRIILLLWRFLREFTDQKVGIKIQEVFLLINFTIDDYQIIEKYFVTLKFKFINIYLSNLQ